MSNNDPSERIREKARRLSSDDFARWNEEDRRRSETEFVSIKDFAAERDRSVRTLRRWNKRSDAPPRVQRGRQLMYRRADAEPWVERIQGRRSE